ncbi:hypothetical protein IscW_ISCW019631 [Ixodes scapularis]|uniref:Uncharacterized protein n=1 Tax=Ixodes scapularis TaxID=6945 RepID=B7PUE0_IXOSC|nr:hypothetical protein IscW_ISCW019631 [Ixodes scapularis]|eukprot:XP_002405962.1 hypothetical protein IscW_ISCW019631 [Ixodes scapularis]
MCDKLRSQTGRDDGGCWGTCNHASFADVHLFAARLERHQKVTLSIRSVVTGETKASLSITQPPARARRALFVLWLRVHARSRLGIPRWEACAGRGKTLPAVGQLQMMFRFDVVCSRPTDRRRARL